MSTGGSIYVSAIALSIQTRIERHEQILKVLLWVTSIVVGAVLTSGVMGLIVLFKWAIRNGAAL